MKNNISIAEQENQIGIEYLQKEDFENALIHWQKAYELGSIEAIYHLANLYYYGEGVERNYEKSTQLFLECASKEGKTRDILESQFNLANAYYNGEGVNKDYNEAFKWYLKAANNGHPSAILNVTIAYFTGQILEKDSEKAFYYANKAAELNLSLGQYIIGVLYLSGDGCKKDTQKAKYYFTLAAEQGDENAKNALLKLQEEEEFEERKKLFKNVQEVNDPSELEDITYVTLDNISEVLKNEEEEYDTSLDDIDIHKMQFIDVLDLADNGNRKAQYFIGVAFMKNEKFDEGIKYLSKSAAFEYPDALYYLGICYLQGIGVKEDIVIGIGHIAKAAKLNNVSANQFMLEYYEQTGEKEKADEIRDRLDFLNN